MLASSDVTSSCARTIVPIGDAYSTPQERGRPQQGLRSTGDDVVRAAHCDQKIAADGLQAAFEIQHRLEKKRGAMHSCLRSSVELSRVVQSIRFELTRVEAVDRQHLRTNDSTRFGETPSEQATSSDLRLRMRWAAVERTTLSWRRRSFRKSTIKRKAIT